MSYQVLTEAETIERAIAGDSLARFGDGELRLALGGEAKSQARDPALRTQLLQILGGVRGRCLVCLPRHDGPKAGWWAEYNRPKFTALYTMPVYGSAFVTRPDSAPWIDSPAYWDRVAELWRSRDVVLVRGKANSLTADQLQGAATVTEIIGPERDAFADIHRLMTETVESLRPGGVVLLCLGATATVMAWRLAGIGIHAIDLGHIGLYMRHRGLYAVKLWDLISDEYLALNLKLHARPDGFGGSGWRHAVPVVEYAAQLKARSILDYGAGRCTLRSECKKRGWVGAFEEYEPTSDVIGRMPKPADLIVCTDVLEHVEPDKLQQVLRHIGLLMDLGAYLTIATRPANTLLPDGRNAHLIVEAEGWWVEQLQLADLRLDHVINDKGKELRVWLRK